MLSGRDRKRTAYVHELQLSPSLCSLSCYRRNYYHTFCMRFQVCRKSKV